MRYLAVDTNYLRIDLPPRVQSAAPDEVFVLTDTTLLESMKTQYWESVARASFSGVGLHLDRFAVARGPGELMRQEFESGNPISAISEILDEGLSAGIRALLGELAAGGAGSNVAYAQSQILSAQRDLATQQLNASDNEHALRDAVRDINKAFHLRGFRNVPDMNQKELIRIGGIKKLSQAAVQNVLQTRGMAPAAAAQWVANDSLTLRMNIGFYLLGWKWAMNGSLPQNPEKITNELMDLDQAVIGTYCAEILTRERNVAELRQDILKVVQSNVQMGP